MFILEVISSLEVSLSIFYLRFFISVSSIKNYSPLINSNNSSLISLTISLLAQPSIILCIFCISSWLTQFSSPVYIISISFMICFISIAYLSIWFILSTENICFIKLTSLVKLLTENLICLPSSVCRKLAPDWSSNSLLVMFSNLFSSLIIVFFNTLVSCMVIATFGR